MSLLMQHKSIFESSHVTTGLAGMALLTAQVSLLPWRPAAAAAAAAAPGAAAYARWCCNPDAPTSAVAGGAEG